MIRTTFIRASAVLLPMAAAAQVASAQLPAAPTLVAKYVAAINGMAIMNAKTITTKGGMSMPSAGLNGTIEMTQSGTNQMEMVTNIPGMGEVQAGYDGTIAWAADPMQGARLLSGKEMDQMKDESDRRTLVRDPQLFSSMTTVADTTMNGERCYEVKLGWKSGRETFDCFSAASGLLIASRTVQVTSMGSVPVVSYFTDYKKFGDITVATKTTMEMMGQQQILTISSVELGTAAKVIVPPPAVQALAKPKQ
ncbi:MAG: hypothetical protein ABIZ36_07480 [Gemmatimonadaceae bacterium]